MKTNKLIPMVCQLGVTEKLNVLVMTDMKQDRKGNVYCLTDSSGFFANVSQLSTPKKSQTRDVQKLREYVEKVLTRC